MCVCVFLCVCVGHVQACPIALPPPTLLPPNVHVCMFHLSSLPPFNLPFPVECWYVRGRTGVYTHTHTPTHTHTVKHGRKREREREKDLTGGSGWEDIQFDKEQSRCPLRPVGHILFTQALEDGSWILAHTYTVLWKLLLCAGDTGSQNLRSSLSLCVQWAAPAAGGSPLRISFTSGLSPPRPRRSAPAFI